jgi:hypothetical protein
MYMPQSPNDIYQSNDLYKKRCDYYIQIKDKI